MGTSRFMRTGLAILLSAWSLPAEAGQDSLGFTAVLDVGGGYLMIPGKLSPNRWLGGIDVGAGLSLGSHWALLANLNLSRAESYRSIADDNPTDVEMSTASLMGTVQWWRWEVVGLEAGAGLAFRYVYVVEEDEPGGEPGLAARLAVHALPLKALGLALGLRTSLTFDTQQDGSRALYCGAVRLGWQWL